MLTTTLKPPFLPKKFKITDLFKNGEWGAIYDFSDLSSLFQDGSGTIPVTAVGQYIGLVLDKSGLGNHARQYDTLKRPLLSARYNLIVNTENFMAISWQKLNSTITANAGLSPDGLNNAFRYQNITTDGSIRITYIATTVAPFTFSIYVKKGNCDWVNISYATASTTVFASGWFNLSTGTIGQIGGGTINSNIEDVGGGWYRCGITANAIGVNFYPTLKTVNSDGIYTQTISQEVLIWGGQLEASLTRGPYQRVVNGSNYNTNGFIPYAKFDGVDDFLVTTPLYFSYTDKITSSAGLRKYSDANAGVLCELSSNVNNNIGSFLILAPASITDKYGFGWRGVEESNMGTTEDITYSSPVTNILTQQLDLSGGTPEDIEKVRINGAPIALTYLNGALAYDLFGNQPLYIGCRGGTTLFSSIGLHSLVICGALLDNKQVINLEKWTNTRAKAY